MINIKLSNYIKKDYMLHSNKKRQKLKKDLVSMMFDKRNQHQKITSIISDLCLENKKEFDKKELHLIKDYVM